MICPDVNLLLYAVDTGSPHHVEAKRWWMGALSSSATVALTHVVVIGFVRLATHARVFERPLTLDEAFGLVDSWLAMPNVRWVSPGGQHWELLKQNLRDAGTAGNLTTDAHIAAVAAEFGLIVHSNDADFGRFAGIKWVNPLASRKS
jgi:toxin-antitoxin system PIN domain toxin